jgi:prepilin-type N-terminal cleavage/methylation domain-containing protein
MIKQLKPTKKSFTLTELLVVIAILAVLMSLLQPALMRTIYSSKKIVCLNNVKHQVSGLLMYADDNLDYYPRSPKIDTPGGNGHKDTWRNADHYGGRLMIARNYHNSDIRMVRPYWGWDNVTTVNNWGILYPAKTDIERCPLRGSPKADDTEAIGHYYFQFSTGKTDGMARVGDARRLNSSNLTTNLVNDVFSDRQSRIANHTEMNPGFVEGGANGHHGRVWTHVNSTVLPEISGNFGGQDGSAREYKLPMGPGFTWATYPGFKRYTHCEYFPDDFIIER